MAYTFDEKIVSDLHKDARGYRPDAYFWEEWTQCGDDTRQAMWDGLLRELNHAIEAERDLHARAEACFEESIQKNLELGAEDRITAIRWILDAEELTEHDLAYGSDYIAFRFDLPYKGRLDSEIASALAEMENG